MSKSTCLRVAPGSRLRGSVRVAGDKSISHRSIILGSIADGITRISGFLDAEDAVATINAFRSMGVSIDGPDNGMVTIEGVGLHGLTEAKENIDLGNSGTSMRLLCGLLAGQKFNSTLTGDLSLSNRPMKRVTQPLSMMGAQIETSVSGTAPLILFGGNGLKGIDYKMPVASAQLKSSLLLAGIYADGQTCVSESAPTRDHTERMLQGFSYPLKHQGSRVCIQGGGRLKATRIDVPADLSSAAFFIVGASVVSGSKVELRHVGINPTRTGILEILKLMGAQIELNNRAMVGGEPVADIKISASPLKGIDIPQELVPLAIDEFPAIFIAAACAKGNTRLKGASELKVKESDRINVMSDGLQRLGIDVVVYQDGLLIKGGQIMGGCVECHGDHRVAMAFAVAGMRARDEVTILEAQNINTSFPKFVQIAQELGMIISVSDSP